MVIQAIIDLILGVIMGLFSLLPDLPNVGQEALQSIYEFFDVILSYLMLLGIFIRPSTINMIVPLLIIVINFEHIWEFIMFIIHKLPFSID